jgi:pimeloyl-ACP methyl ester carboxylesterase
MPLHCAPVDRLVEGVHVVSIRPDPPSQAKRAPIVFIHGGCHGSWAFEYFQSYFSEAGWETHALNWFNHNGSKPLELPTFLARGIADVATEIGIVRSTLSAAPILIAHSMGGLAALKYAEEAKVHAMVLLAPVVPLEVGAEAIALPVDAGQPWGPPPFEVARRLFMHGLDEAMSRSLYQKLCPESPRSVMEATRFSVGVDRSRVTCPTLAIGAEYDPLVPAAAVEELSRLCGATFVLAEGRGHNLLLEPRWQETASTILSWLDRCATG